MPRRGPGPLSRSAAALAAVLAVGLPSAGEAGPIAILKSKDIQIYNDAIVGFRTNCAGQHLEFDMDEDFTKGERIAREINGAGVDAVFVLGTRAAMTARRHVDASVPVVFALVLDPDQSEIRAPNVTGVRMEIPIRTQLEALRAIVPRVRRVGVMYNPRRSESMVREAAEVAKSLDIQIVASRIERKEDAVRALSVFAGGIDAFWLIADPTVANAEVFPQLLQFTIQNRTPFFAFSEAFVRARALFSLSPNHAGIGRQACGIVRDVVGGKPVADVPWQDPTGLQLSVNLQTAQQLGLGEISVNAFSYAASKGYQVVPVQ